jgi:hypothetical protein
MEYIEDDFDDDNPYVGGSAIVGYDDGDEYGDDPEMGGPQLVQVAPNAFMEQIMPFEEASVGAGLAVDIIARPQRKIRTERLVVGSDIASDFTFSRLTIGQDNMFVSNGNISCGVFSEVAVGMKMRGYTASLGTVVTMTVTNRSAAAITFRAAIRGTVATSI